MRWWGWGEDGHDVTLPPAAEELLRGELGLDPAARSEPVALDDVRLPEPALPSGLRERLAGAAGDPESVRDDREARVGHSAGRSYPDLVRLRSGDASRAPDAVVRPGSADRLRAAAGGVRRGASRGCPVRRRHERGGWRRAGERRLRRPRSRSTCAGLDRVLDVDRDVAHRDARGRAVRAGGRAAARGRGPHARPLPAVVRVLHGRRLGGHALGRPGVHGLRADRRAGGGPAPRVARRRAERARRAGVRRRARPARAGGGLRGRARRDRARRRCGCARRPRARRYEGWSFRCFAEGCDALRAMEQAGCVAATWLGSPTRRRRACRWRSPRAGAAPSGWAARYLRLRGHEGGCLAIVGLRGRRGRGRAPAPAARPRSCGRAAGSRSGARPGRGLAARPLRGALPARRAARPRRARRDARDGHHLEQPRRALRAVRRRAARRARGARHAAARDVPRLPPLPVRRVALLHLPGAPGADDALEQWRAAKTAAVRRDRGRAAAPSPTTTRSGATTRRGWRPRWASWGWSVLRGGEGARSTRPGS